MSNKLARREIPGWGEDLSSFLELCRKEGDLELASQVEEKLLAGYLMALRQEFMGNPEVRRVVSESHPASEAKPWVEDVLCGLARPGSRDVFEKAVDVILQELEVQRKNPPSAYLVDVSTGRSVVPLTKEAIFQPPDYVGEDGQVHKARPVVHPSITSAVGLAAQEAHRRQKLALKAELPEYRHALAHLSGPEGIVLSAKERLTASGITVLDEPSGEPEDVEFGRENVEGVAQAPNWAFHRQSSFAAVLATKIMKICGPGGSCYVGTAREMKSSRQRWFLVPVTATPSGPTPPG